MYYFKLFTIHTQSHTGTAQTHTICCYLLSPSVDYGESTVPYRRIHACERWSAADHETAVWAQRDCHSDPTIHGHTCALECLTPALVLGHSLCEHVCTSGMCQSNIFLPKYNIYFFGIYRGLSFYLLFRPH